MVNWHKRNQDKGKTIVCGQFTYMCEVSNRLHALFFCEWCKHTHILLRVNQYFVWLAWAYSIFRTSNRNKKKTNVAWFLNKNMSKNKDLSKQIKQQFNIFYLEVTSSIILMFTYAILTPMMLAVKVMMPIKKSHRWIEIFSVRLTFGFTYTCW